MLLRIRSPSAQISPSPASLTPSHGPISFLITQNGEKNYQNLETSTIQEETDFEMVVSWLIDWIYLKRHGTDKSIDWLMDWLIDWFDWLIDWLVDCLIDWCMALASLVTRASHLLPRIFPVIPNSEKLETSYSFMAGILGAKMFISAQYFRFGLHFWAGYEYWKKVWKTNVACFSRMDYWKKYYFVSK